MSEKICYVCGGPIKPPQDWYSGGEDGIRHMNGGNCVDHFRSQLSAALGLIREHGYGQNSASLDDALRQLLQVAVTERDNAKTAVSKLAAANEQAEKMRGALEKAPCRCVAKSFPACPQCGGQLYRVTQSPNSMLNSYQFDAVKAGDWYCASCKGAESNTGYKYFWDGDLKQEKIVCARCAALSSPSTGLTGRHG